MPKERLLFIDYGKALCIILVVCIHAGVGWANQVGYILMALFFFASGYTAHYEKRGIAQNAENLFRKIMIPYFVAGLAYGVCEIFRAQYLGYGDASIFLPALVGVLYGSLHKVPPIPGVDDTLRSIMAYKPGGSEFVDVILPLNCHLWFLPAMFTGAMLFVIYLKTAGKKRKLYVDIIAIIALLALAYIESLDGVPQFPYALGRGFFCCACMIAGRVFREREVFEWLESGRRRLVVGFIVLLVIDIIAWFLTGDDRTMASMARSEFGPCGAFGPALTFIGGVSGTAVIFIILRAFERRWKPKTLAYVGRNTMTIYLWHMFVLTVVSILILMVAGVGVAQDIWYMSIIPKDQVVLVTLSIVLTLLGCLGIAALGKRLARVRAR